MLKMEETVTRVHRKFSKEKTDVVTEEAKNSSAETKTNQTRSNKLKQLE
jgi:hypothetical protein